MFINWCCQRGEQLGVEVCPECARISAAYSEAMCPPPAARYAVERDIKILVKYLKMKTRQRDWHGVSDAANDLRELEAKRSQMKGK